MATKTKLIFEGENRTRRAFSEINSSMGRLSGTVGALTANLRGMVGVLSVGLFARAGKESLDFADKVQKLSIRLGATTEFLSELRFAGEQTGVSFQTLALGMQRAQRRIAEAANGTGEAREALRELGLDARALNELSLEDKFDVLAEALEGVESQSDKVRLAMKLFDTEGVALLQTMEGGAEATRALRDEARQLGVTLDQDAANKAAAANDAFNRFGSVIRGVVQEIALNLAPALEAVGNFLAIGVPQAINLTKAAWNVFAGAAKRALAGVLQVVEFFLTKLAEIANFLNAPGADSLQGAADKLGNIADQLTLSGQESLDAATGFFKLGFAIRDVSAASQDAKDDIADITNQVADPLAGLEGSFGLRGSNRKGADEAIENAIGGSGALQGISERISNALSDGVLRGGEGMKEAFTGILAEMAQQLFKSSLAQAIAGIFGGAGGGFGGFISGLFGGGRQAGGAVSPDRAYLVGESGPELFVPNSAGAVMANRLGTGRGGVVYNIDARGATPGVELSIRDAIKQAQAQTEASILEKQRRGRFK